MYASKLKTCANEYAETLTEDQITFVKAVLLNCYKRYNPKSPDGFVPLEAMRIPMSVLYDAGVTLRDEQGKIQLWAILSAPQFSEIFEIRTVTHENGRKSSLFRMKPPTPEALAQLETGMKESPFRSQDRGDSKAFLPSEPDSMHERKAEGELLRFAYWGDTKQIPAKVFNDLKDIARPEQWYHGQPVRRGEKEPMPIILKNCFIRTFWRLLKEDPNMEKKILISEDGKHLIFNTGLVDNSSEPIYCILEKNEPGYPQEWCYPGVTTPKRGGFCTTKSKAWKKVLDKFPNLPSAAQFCTDSSQLELPDGALDMLPFTYNYKHIIIEKAKRFPRAIRDCSESDHKALFEKGLERAIAGFNKNKKIAVPFYYPEKNEISFFIPWSSRDDASAESAVLIAKSDTDTYTAISVYPCTWAYRYARVLGPVDSEWLRPDLCDSAAPDIGDNG